MRLFRNLNQAQLTALVALVAVAVLGAVALWTRMQEGQCRADGRGHPPGRGGVGMDCSYATHTYDGIMVPVTVPKGD